MTDMTFSLEQWFDITQPISKSDADLAEAQMMLYALKQGDVDPDGLEARAEYRKMRKAVADHNSKFPALELYRSKASKTRQAKREKEKKT
jgi:hypothetical protein